MRNRTTARPLLRSSSTLPLTNLSCGVGIRAKGARRCRCLTTNSPAGSRTGHALAPPVPSESFSANHADYPESHLKPHPLTVRLSVGLWVYVICEIGGFISQKRIDSDKGGAR